MATTPEATKGVPRSEGNTAPTLRADHNAHADWSRDNVNTRVATTAARDAIVNKYAGLIVQTADTNSVWQCTAIGTPGTWTLLFDETGWTVATLTVIGSPWVAFGAPYAAPSYRRRNGVVYLKGVAKTGSSTTLFTLPVGFRPLEQQVTNVASVNSWAVCNITPAGQVQITAYGTGASSANVSFDNIQFLAEA